MNAGEHPGHVSQQINEMLIAIERQEALLRRMRVDLEKLSLDLSAIALQGKKGEKHRKVTAPSATS